MEHKHLDSLLIVLGDFHRGNLRNKLPKYRQHIKRFTRDRSTLDHRYNILKDAYCSVPWIALELSDHCLVYVLLSYRQKLSTLKPVFKMVRS